MQRVAVAPVHLRAEIVHYLLFAACGQPSRHIAVLAVEVVVRIPLRADAEPQRGVCGLHRVVHCFYQRRHVLPPPRRKAGRTAGRKLRRIDAFLGGGVKIIVKVDAIHCIVLHKLRHALHHVIRSGRLGRVQVQPLSHSAHPLRVGVGKAVLGKVRRHGGGGPQPVGVHPRFYRESPRVGLLQQDIQRVKARVLPLHTGAQVAPREQTAFVQRVSKRPHLRQHRVQAQPCAVL